MYQQEKDVEGESVVWTSVHSFQYKKDKPDKIYFKYNYDDPYRTLTILCGRRKSTGCIEGYQLKKLYSKKNPISDAKYNDLQMLCRKEFIPEIHHQFYSGLPHTGMKDMISDESDDEQ